MRKNNTLWTGKYILAVLILFGLCLVSNMVLSALTIFAKNLTNLDTYAGLMTSIFTLGALSVRLLTGFFLDRFNCKRVILFGLGLMFISTLLFLFCDSIFTALVYRLIQGFGFGIASTGASTYTIKNTNPDYLLEGVSYSSIANGLTAVIGPSIGYSLIGLDYNRFDRLFIVGVVIIIITAVMMVLGRDVSKTEGGSPELSNKQEVINKKILIVPLIILFCNSLTQSGVVSFMSLFAISLGFSGVGMFFSINAVGIIASRFVMNRLVRKFGKFPMIIFNSFIFGISIYFISGVSSVVQLMVLAFPAGFAMGSVAPIVNTYVVENLPEAKIGIGNALYYSSLDLGYGIGSLVWGLVATSLSYQSIFIMGALIQVICIVLAYTHQRNYVAGISFEKAS